MKDLNNKVIIVTGGRGLIGREIVKELRERGAVAIDTDMSVDTDAEARTFHLDLTDNGSIDALIEFTLSNYGGRIDGLINAAYPHTPDWGRYKFEDTPFEHWSENVRIQLNPVFYIDQQVARVMARQKSGSIVNFGSIYGIVGNDFTIYEEYGGSSPAEYCAIKGASSTSRATWRHILARMAYASTACVPAAYSTISARSSSAPTITVAP